MQSTYFQSNHQYFWQWEENGEVVAIPNSHTIAYREQLLELIRAFVNQGLPPFGTLLLAMIATNSRGKVALEAIAPILEKAVDNYDKDEVRKAIEFLNVLSDVPVAYKVGKNRIHLLLSIFQQAHNIYSVKKSRKYLFSFEEKKGLALGRPNVVLFTRSVVRRDFKTLSLLQERFPDKESIIQNLGGLPEFPEDIIEVEPQKKETTEPADFIEQLIEDETTFPIGSLVKRIWSGLRIPFHNNVPSQQPLGGVADLTNKGDFDKLLLSEFANDDLVFLSRLANNEALYYHREIPPADNQLQRIILIDISLKNWGKIRTIAYAIMLAIAYHPKTNIDCEVYVIGGHYYKIKIDSIEKIIRSLQILEATLDAGKGLATFFEQKDLKHKEVFLIANEKSLKYPETQRIMLDHFSMLDYWIHPTEDGQVDLYKRQQNSKKYVQTIQLPLKELWKKENTRPKKENTNHSFKKTYPILFDIPIGVKTNMISEDGYVYKITKEKALLRSFHKLGEHHKSGWELLNEKLPYSHGDFAIGESDQGNLILLIYNIQDKHITLFNVNDETKIVLAFPHWYYTKESRFTFFENAFYFNSYRALWKISLDGQVSEARNQLDTIINKVKKQGLAIAGVAEKTNSFRQVFKNLTNISINGNGELCFNIHCLHLSDKGIIKINLNTSDQKLARAKRINKDLYEFSEGSKVYINRVGMFTLESSNPDLRKIYIPSVLNRNLGVMGGVDFAGNDYYLKMRRCNLSIKNLNGKTIEVIKRCKIVTGLGLKDIREIIESSGKTFNNLAEPAAITLRDDLLSIGVHAELSLDVFSYKKIGTQQFFNQHMKPFINHIIKHGTTD